METRLKAFVRQRANHCCEYCRLNQAHYDIPFHIEHIIAKKHLGTSDENNLALACHHCNLFKGSNLSGIEPVSGEMTRLFHPRQDVWEQHFLAEEGFIKGLTPIGATTTSVLRMNLPDRVRTRLRLP